MSLFLPRFLQEMALSLARLFPGRLRFLPSHSSASQSIKLSCIIIEDSKKDRERYRWVRTYLSNKSRQLSSAPIPELPKPKNSKADQLEIEETFDGMQLKWSMGSKEENYKKLGIIPGVRMIQFFALSFPDEYQSKVDSAYLPYVQKEAARIEGEKKELQWKRIQALGCAAGLVNLIAGIAKLII